MKKKSHLFFKAKATHFIKMKLCFLEAESEDKIVPEAGEVEEKEKSKVSDLKDIFSNPYRRRSHGKRFS